MSCRLCSRAPRMTSQSSPGGRRRSGTGMIRLPARYWPVIDPSPCSMPGTGRDDLAAVLAGAGADVDDPVGRRIVSSSCSTTRNRVAEVAQPVQRVDQAPVVALVEADRRLVEHVQHADQARADLRRQADALRLAAGQRAGERDSVR